MSLLDMYDRKLEEIYEVLIFRNHGIIIDIINDYKYFVIF